MKYAFLQLLVLVIVFFPVYQLKAEPVLNPANGHYYELSEGISSWTDARVAAESLIFGGKSGYLATITSQEENEFIANTFKTEGDVIWHFWVGGFQPSGSPNEPSGDWQWVTGESFTYTRWGSGEPNNTPSPYGEEDYLEFRTASGGLFGTWNDLYNGDIYYLVEWEGNEAPMVGAINAPSSPLTLNTQVDANVTFEDSDTDDTHTAEWDWGDGNTSPPGPVIVTEPSNGTPGSVTGSHTYTQAGVYTVEVTVIDDAGSSDSSIFQYIVVYDPDGGFVTGGGWVYSEAGNYAPDPSIEGKANFGFVSKYKKGAALPTGNTQFGFRVADLNFHSASYQWLVVAHHKAMFKGNGTVNGEGNYGFLLSAIDADLTPSTDVDLFRIKIWDKDNGDVVVYDNETGAADDAEPATAIGGGSIVIHNTNSAPVKQHAFSPKGKLSTIWGKLKAE